MDSGGLGAAAPMTIIPLRCPGACSGEVHSSLGFSAGSVAPLVFGAVLDMAGPVDAVAGGATVTQWGLAFSTLALGSLVVLTMTALLHRQMGRSKLSTAQAQ